MNIYYNDTCPFKAAVSLCDKHNNKMLVEAAQLLSTAHAELDGASPAYRPTHRNHPCAVWVRASADHYAWLWCHMIGLGEEYTRRYGRVHKTIADHAETLAVEPLNIPEAGFTPPPQCMPEEYRGADTVQAYRRYYSVGKRGILTYRHSKAPDWLLLEHSDLPVRVA